MSKKRSDDRRAAQRFDARIDGRLNCSQGTRRSIEITDISIGGCSVVIGSQYAAGGRGYAIKIDGLETLGAEIRWIAGEGAGLQFERPLHPAVLDHIVQANPAQGDVKEGAPETVAD